MLSGIVSKAGLYGLLRIVIPKFPAVVARLARRPARARVDLARLRLAARVPRARLPRRRHVLVARPVRPDRARPVREQRPRLRRRRAADGQPRARSRRRCSCSPAWSSGARRPASSALLGGMARGRPALATLVMTAGIISLAVPLSTSFAGEFLILAGVFQQGWAWAVIGAAGSCWRRCTCSAPISGVLHQEVGPGGAGRGARPAPRRARRRRAARRLPARPLGLAEPDLAAARSAAERHRTARRRWQERRSTANVRRPASDRQAAHRLVRALAVAVAARRVGAPADGRGLHAADDPARSSRRSSASQAS